MARKARPTPFLDAARKGGKVRTTLEGTEDLEAAIKQLDENLQGEILRAAVDKGAEILRGAASSLAPTSADGSHGREPGFLSRNILKERQWTTTQATATTDVGMEKWKAWYGRFQEFGTYKEPAQPFLRPAFDETKNDMVDAIAEHLRARILRDIG
jgi:HK97 gp10 family phage protein